MTDKMLKFVNIDLQTPNKRKVKSRLDDFKEIYDQFIHEKAKEQSSRCSQCGVPFCQVHCPLHNNIPDWLKLAAEDRLQEASELAHSTNNMPEVCGRICPQDRLCEGNCVIERSGHGTVTIGSVEKYITDTAWNKGWIKPIKITKEQNQSIGIIGAGNIGSKIGLYLTERGAKVYLNRRNKKKLSHIVKAINLLKPSNSKENAIQSDKLTAARNADVLIGSSNGKAVIDSKMINSLKKNSIIIDAGKGTLTEKALSLAIKRKFKIYRVDIFPSLEGLIAKSFSMENQIVKYSKKKKVNGFNILNTGVLGRYGDIIVDNIDDIKIVYGICDGKGDFIRKIPTKYKTIINKLTR